jgi:Fe-S-cluster containining protein
MGLETDLDEIRKLAEERDDENWKFCTFLKQRDGVDKRAYRILEGVLAGIDCTTCGNCCLTMEVCVTDTDVARLAVHLSVTPKKFREQYVVRDEHGNARLRGRPCVFPYSWASSAITPSALSSSTFMNASRTRCGKGGESDEQEEKAPARQRSFGN